MVTIGDEFDEVNIGLVIGGGVLTATLVGVPEPPPPPPTHEAIKINAADVIASLIVLGIAALQAGNFS